MNKPFTLSASFCHRIEDAFGAEGTEWLKHLPDIVDACTRHWSLTIQPHFKSQNSDLSYNYVAPALRQNGTAVVLKVGVPNPELWTEIDALSLFAGHGIVQLLDVDRELGAMLLERLEPGQMLVGLSDDQEATSIAGQVMAQVWRSPPKRHSFPTVGKWAGGLARMRDRYNGDTGPLPASLIEVAEKLFAELIESMDEVVLLHGDLHHYNILSAKRAPWLAIDPKGVIGEPAYEVGALLRNPYPQLLNNPDVDRITARRVDQLASELGFDRQRIIDWSIAQAVLSACWSVDDHGQGWEYGIRCAEILSTLN